MSGKSLMHDGGESYCGVVSTKQPNKSDVSPAEAVEKRPQTKENTQQPNLFRTQCRESRPSGLERVREVARKDRKLTLLSRRALRRQTSEVGTVCVSSASTGLCGGHRATDVPTATASIGS
jgi:hypothetical protein